MKITIAAMLAATCALVAGTLAAVGPADAAPVTETATLTVLQNNIDGRLDTHKGGPLTVNHVVSAIQAHRPDFVLLEEVCFQQLRYLRVQLAKLHVTGYHFTFGAMRQDNAADGYPTERCSSSGNYVAAGQGYDHDYINNHVYAENYWFGNVVGVKGTIKSSYDTWLRGGTSSDAYRNLHSKYGYAFSGQRPITHCIKAIVTSVLRRHEIKACAAHLDSRAIGSQSGDSLRATETRTFVSKEANPSFSAGQEVIFGGDLNANPPTSASLNPLYSNNIFHNPATGQFREGDEHDTAGGKSASSPARRQGACTHVQFSAHESGCQKYDYVFYSDYYASHTHCTRCGRSYNMVASVGPQYRQGPQGSDHRIYLTSGRVEEIG